MKNKFVTTVLIALFAIYQLIGQVTTEIVDVLVNSQNTVNNCNLVDFGSTNNNTLTIYFKLTRGANQATGNVNVDALLKYSSSTNPGTNKGTFIVLDNQWTNGGTRFEGQIPVNISSSEIQVTGSSIYIKSTTSGNIERNSCEYPLRKDAVPTFTLSSSTNSVSCGSTTPVTFTVNNVYNSPGTLTYNWNVGSGWSPSGSFTTTSNTIQLTPTSFPPTQVKVTPVLNGVNQPQLTKNVTLSPFSPGYQVTGNASLCTTAVYSVNNLPAGISVTGWTSSNTSVATVSSNGNQATLTTVGNGVVNIQASLVNSCGQTAMISKNGIIVGAPTVVNHTINGGFSNMSVNDTSVLSVSAVTGATQYYWTITPSTSCSAGIGPRFSGSNATTITTTSTSVIVNWNDCIGTYAVVAYAKNGCGQSYIATKWVNVFDSSNNPCDRIAGGIKVVPNPVKHGSLTLYKEAPVDPCERISTKLVKIENVENEVKIYDMYSKVVYNGFFNSDIMKITDLKLNSGNYILYVYSSSGETIRQMIIVE